ncbi:hypothetical protein K8942_06015 [Candidatus Peribacteria bacterium]|nr:MAG: hypothetical protein K8942_06015 [Candidatus Peribacteria bacterium]
MSSLVAWKALLEKRGGSAWFRYVDDWEKQVAAQLSLQPRENVPLARVVAAVHAEFERVNEVQCVSLSRAETLPTTLSAIAFWKERLEWATLQPGTSFRDDLNALLEDPPEFDNPEQGAADMPGNRYYGALEARYAYLDLELLTIVQETICEVMEQFIVRGYETPAASPENATDLVARLALLEKCIPIGVINKYTCIVLAD